MQAIFQNFRVQNAMQAIFLKFSRAFFWWIEDAENFGIWATHKNAPFTKNSKVQECRLCWS